MLENISIGTPINWNEMITVNNLFSNEKYNELYLHSIPFLNINLRKKEIKSLTFGNDILKIDKNDLIVLLEETIENYKLGMRRDPYTSKLYQDKIRVFLNRIKTIEGNLNLTFKKHKAQKAINTYSNTHAEIFSVINVYIMDVYNYSSSINFSEIKEELKNQKYLLPLLELDKHNFLKNINPVTQKEVGCTETNEMTYSGYTKLQGFGEKSKFFIKESETIEYEENLKNYLILKFGDKDLIKSDFKKTSFKKSLYKDEMIRNFKLNDKKKTTKYLVYTNNSTMSAVFDECTGYCKMIKEIYNKETMLVSYYAKNGFLLSQYFTTNLDFKQMNQRNFSLSDSGDCISTIIYEDNAPVKHLLRMNDKKNIYKNYTKSLLLMFEKYNSLMGDIIVCSKEKEILKIMKQNKMNVSTMRGKLRKYNQGEENIISQDTIDLLIMKYII